MTVYLIFNEYTCAGIYMSLKSTTKTSVNSGLVYVNKQPLLNSGCYIDENKQDVSNNIKFLERMCGKK